VTGSVSASHEWRAERPPVELSPEEVHLWRAPTALPREAIARLWGALDVDEERRALRLPKGAVRNAFVATRAALRLVLAGYAGIDAGGVALRYGPHGKPYLVTDGTDRQLDFSVSHSGEISLIAVATAREIGIDAELERPRRRARRVAQRVFRAGTADLLARLSPAEHDAAFAAAWTQREAYAKALGVGVFRSRDALAFAWPRTDGVRLCEEQPVSGSARVWSLYSLAPAAGYAATLVADGALEGVRCFDAAAVMVF
jgi:4'-phosphopantetheinyl transferase